MENKYLPIGTICSIDGKDKIMITGYFSIEYNGNVKMYDYRGCIYPEGLLLSNKQLSFNHTDIKNIEYMGFKNEQYDILNNVLNRNAIEDKDTEYQTMPVLNNIKFDENGVVTFDGTVSEVKRAEPSQEIVNPFKQEYAQTSALDDNVDKIFGNYKFNDDGVVIEDTPLEEKKVSKSKYQFDENGFVIAEVKDEEIEVLTTNSPNYKFDDDGVVISE